MRSAAIREQPGMVGRVSQLEGILNRGVCLLDDQDTDIVSRFSAKPLWTPYTSADWCVSQNVLSLRWARQSSSTTFCRGVASHESMKD